jgi:hypothetical protein
MGYRQGIREPTESLNWSFQIEGRQTGNKCIRHVQLRTPLTLIITKDDVAWELHI